MSFISRLHQTLRESRFLAPDPQDSTAAKAYPRFFATKLPAAELLELSFTETLKRRRSFHTAASRGPLSAQAWGTLLGTAIGHSAARRAYPSGGARYPIEIYVIGSVLEGFAPGVFHYDPLQHTLEHLWEMPPRFAMRRLFRGSATPVSETALILTSVWDRSEVKYGRFAYDLALLEAGHIAQNILLAATAASIAARPVAGFNDTGIEKLLDLDDREQAVYAIMLSKTAGASESGSETISE